MFALLRLFFMNGLMHPLFVAMGLSVLVAHSYAGQDHEHESPHQDEYKIDEHDEHGDNDHDEHNEDEHGHEEDGHSDSVTIDALTAEQSGIKTAMARSGDIATTRRVFAKVANDPSQISHIGARFDGTIIFKSTPVSATGLKKA